MSYSRGVLIHNFNEDQYGLDLQRIPKLQEPPKLSVSHTVHHWKTPPERERLDAVAAHGLHNHVLFGHAGDMRDPHTNLQKREFATSHSYFFQDPAKIGSPGTLTADGFAISDEPLRVYKEPSVIADKVKDGWGDKRQTHSLPPGDRFLTEHKRNFIGLRGGGEKQENQRILAYREFSSGLDAPKLTRSSGRLATSGLRGTGRLVMR